MLEVMETVPDHRCCVTKRSLSEREFDRILLYAVAAAGPKVA